MSITFFECPWAESTTRTSTPAWISESARSKSITPIAAPTRNRPRASLHALGKLSILSMSLIVINPFRRY